MIGFSTVAISIAMKALEIKAAKLSRTPELFILSTSGLVAYCFGAFIQIQAAIDGEPAAAALQHEEQSRSRASAQPVDNQQDNLDLPSDDAEAGAQHQTGRRPVTRSPQIANCSLQCC